ncbi:hypothetical protein B484DRAFT_409696 [Ochromonadaceae sp. CCMP2298]|nr:hypothetical protein B484DRAFT_409696 [Ochromonadaceae sp. CCMP2298]
MDDDLFGVQQTSSEETANSFLSWEDDVSYDWVIRRIGMIRADICEVRRNDHDEAFRWVVFHFEEGAAAQALATSLPDFLRFRRDDGLHPEALDQVFHHCNLWWQARYVELPLAEDAEARFVLRQYAQQHAAQQAGPLTLGHLHW